MLINIKKPILLLLLLLFTLLSVLFAVVFYNSKEHEPSSPAISTDRISGDQTSSSHRISEHIVIPLPPGSHKIEQSLANNTRRTWFEVDLDPENVYDFYEKAMKQQGWKPSCVPGWEFFDFEKLNYNHLPECIDYEVFDVKHALLYRENGNNTENPFMVIELLEYNNQKRPAISILQIVEYPIPDPNK